MSANIDLSGQVALVTGGGQGLGRSFALALGKAGAKIAVTARTAAAVAETADMIERAGGRALAVPGDASEPEAVAAAVETVQSELGPIDILVNNAGIIGPIGNDWTAKVDDWWRTFEVNMKGPFLHAQAVLPGMLARRRGRIVNVSSGAAVTRLPLIAAYCASKSALTHWTYCLAQETAAHGVVVLAFGPGFVVTPATEHLLHSPDVPQETGDFFRAFVKEGRNTPIARSTEMLLFLASGKADALSGRFIHSSDDEAALLRRIDEIRRDNLHVLAVRK